MDAVEIEKRLRLGEDSVTEFKGVQKNDFKIDPADFAKTVVCMANGSGGDILVGVEDDGVPTGIGSLKQADDLMRQITQVCQDRIRPAIYVRVTKAEVGGVSILVVDVPSFAPDRPYRVDHIYYIRDANRCREATRDELVRLLQSQDAHYDEQPVSGARMEDLDSEAIRQFYKAMRKSPLHPRRHSAFLRALQCVDEHGTPTVAGILFFARDVERWFPDARISAVRFNGTEVSGTFADRKEITGRLPRQVDDAMAFLSRHLSSPAKIKGLKRKEMGIPVEVLREAVLNAVSHRDYRPRSQTTIFVFDDRVQIINPGVLLNRLTLDNIREVGTTQRRNPIIAALLNRSYLKESLGIGIPDMIDLVKQCKLPEPTFDLLGGFFRVVLRIKEPTA